MKGITLPSPDERIITKKVGETAEEEEDTEETSHRPIEDSVEYPTCEGSKSHICISQGEKIG